MLLRLPQQQAWQHHGHQQQVARAAHQQSRGSSKHCQAMMQPTRPGAAATVAAAAHVAARVSTIKGSCSLQRGPHSQPSHVSAAPALVCSGNSPTQPSAYPVASIPNKKQLLQQRPQHSQQQVAEDATSETATLTTSIESQLQGCSAPSPSAASRRWWLNSSAGIFATTAATYFQHFACSVMLWLHFQSVQCLWCSRYTEV
jgi:hypothetical protein